MERTNAGPQSMINQSRRVNKGRRMSEDIVHSGVVGQERIVNQQFIRSDKTLHYYLAENENYYSSVHQSNPCHYAIHHCEKVYPKYSTQEKIDYHEFRPTTENLHEVEVQYAADLETFPRSLEYSDVILNSQRQALAIQSMNSELTIGYVEGQLRKQIQKNAASYFNSNIDNHSPLHARPSYFGGRYEENRLRGYGPSNIPPDIQHSFKQECANHDGLEARYAAHTHDISDPNFDRMSNFGSETSTQRPAQSTNILLSNISPQTPFVERDFVCNICDKSFVRRYNLETHQRTHQNIRPYNCKFCPKKFGRMFDLKRHELTHTTAKPFTCEHCDRGFRRSDGLKRHQRVNDKGEMMFCPGRPELDQEHNETSTADTPAVVPDSIESCTGKSN